MMNLQSFIIRAVYLVVFAVLLGYLGAHEQRIRGEMTMLAAWPDPAGQTANEVIRDLLIAATRVVATPRAVAVWIESEEPWLYVAAWVDGGFTFTREAPTTFEPLVATALAGRGFLCADAHANPAVVLVSHDGQLERWRGAVALHPDLVERYVRGPLLALPLAGGTLEGLLLLSGRPGLTADELVLGEIVAGLVGDRLDRFNLTQRLRATAASEERVRLGRDLHDGVLQSFTGIGLRLAATRRRAEESPRQLGEDLLQLQRLVTDEQRDLRFFIRELTSSPVDDDGTEQHLTARLGELAQRIEQVWGLRLRLESAAVPADLAPDRAREIYNLVREAVINAARHGAAGVVEVSVRPATAGWLAITVRDDGRGFPFTGRFTLKQLAECGVGPRTLRERIAALGGELWIDSQASGSTIEMRLPRESTPA